MRGPLGGSRLRIMGKRLILAGYCLLTACARNAGLLSSAEFCDQMRPVPSSWRETKIPASAATLRLPRSYVNDDNVWRGPRGGFISVTWHPHRQPQPPAPGSIMVGGPECSHQLGERTVSFERWAEFPVAGGLRYVTVARWEEVAGTDVAVTAGAMDAKEQLEQLRVIHSLRR